MRVYVTVCQQQQQQQQQQREDMMTTDASPLSRVIDALNKNTATLDTLFTDKVSNHFVYTVVSVNRPNNNNNK